MSNQFKKRTLKIGLHNSSLKAAKQLYYSVPNTAKVGIELAVFISYAHWAQRPHNCRNIILCTIAKKHSNNIISQILATL